MKKIINSYSVIQTPSGIIELIINTTEKWVNYHQANDYTYYIGDSPNEETLIITQHFLNKNKSYLSTHLQNKDQICFYFIPKEMLGATKETIKKRKLIDKKFL